MVIYILLFFYLLVSFCGYIFYYTYKKIHFYDRPFFENLPPGDIIGVEVGVYKGENAERILKKYKNIKHLYLVDPYEVDKKTDYGRYSDYEGINLDDAYNLVKQKIAPWREKVTFIKKKSLDALKDLPDDLDFVYLDAQHDEKPVHEDIKTYSKKLSKSGIIGGHDYFIPGINKAVKRFSSETKYTLFHKFPDWWFKKKDE